MGDVVKFHTSPNDLMTIREIEVKHGFTYSYLYKHARLGNLTLYPRGVFKLSEREVLNFVERKTKNKWQALERKHTKTRMVQQLPNTT